MGKKKTIGNDLEQKVAEIIADVGDDRERLTAFLDKFISEYEGSEYIAIAEHVAKLAEALTRQHQVRVAAVKAVKLPIGDEDDDMDELQGEIGMPFAKEEAGDGSN